MMPFSFFCHYASKNLIKKIYKYTDLTQIQFFQIPFVPTNPNTYPI